MNKSNYKKCLNFNNKKSKQISKNLIYSIKLYLETNHQNNEFPFIDSSLNIIKSYLKNLKKLKIQ